MLKLRLDMRTREPQLKLSASHYMKYYEIINNY